MSDIKVISSYEFPSFGETQYTGVTLEILQNGLWEVFQPFYFDSMLEKQQKYYVKSFEDIKGYEIMGKVQISRNSDVIVRATSDMLRVRPS